MEKSHPFFVARKLLLECRGNYDRAVKEFRWPQFETFNWALDWFDFYAIGNPRPALRLVREDGGRIEDTSLTFQQLSARSAQVANFLSKHGLKRGDRALVMLPNHVAIWEFTLGAMKLGVVVVPTSVQATTSDLSDRIARGEVRWVLTDEPNSPKFENVAGNFVRCLVGKKSGWICFSDSEQESANYVPTGVTKADDPCLLYFTSGTTAKPKMVMHTHQSYPVGHLSTMFWIGIQETDIHQNISSPGWAKHAWSSFFAPWNAGATIFVLEMPRFQAGSVKHWLEKAGVNNLCAPPTVWRMMILEALGKKPSALKELVSAGEPLNAEVIEQVAAAWGITIRDGFGQTETTAQIANCVGTTIKPGSMGRPLPGYDVVLLDAENREGDEGEIALRLNPRPLGLMQGYLDDPTLTADVMAAGFYRTGDEATRDKDGYIHFVGRGDDVFKSSDYRLSPFELESVLLEHPAVAEAAIVPSPDPVRLTVPKAFIVLKADFPATAETAKNIFSVTNQKLAGYKRIRRLQFSELPKTISGKIRRVELRKQEALRREKNERAPLEFFLHE